MRRSTAGPMCETGRSKESPLSDKPQLIPEGPVEGSQPPPGPPEAVPPAGGTPPAAEAQAAGDAATFDQVLSQLLADVSEDTRVWLQTIYESLPIDKKNLMTANLAALAQDLKPAVFYKIVHLALRQYEGVFDRERRQISIVGPVNVGKSALFNALLRPKQPQAQVSPVPGTTKVAQAADAGLCTVIDTPGGDEAAGQDRRRLALEAARVADSLIVVFDAYAGINQSSRDLFDELRRLGKPMTLVLNKIDLVKGYEKEVIAKAAHDLGVAEKSLIAISATRRINLEQVVFSLVRLNPGLLALVSDLVPHYRRQIAARYIAGAAISAFAVGSTPLPVADFMPLSAIQIGLVLQLSRVYGQRITWDKAREILLTLGGGFGLREGFRQLLKIVPAFGINWLISGVYAAVATAALGMAAREYWAHGGIGSPAEWRRAALRFRRRVWAKLRSPRSLRRLSNRERAAGLLEETLERQLE